MRENDPVWQVALRFFRHNRLSIPLLSSNVIPPI